MTETEVRDNAIQDSSSYDEIIYDQLPHRQGNLRLLETIGDLYGVEPVDIHHCRVLEIGTATGKTLIPQAEELPESQFLGIDLSPVQIDIGKELLRSLNLRNIELRAANMMEIDESWGEFDYIIAHGIYSWVPPVVREKMLEICQKNLSPHGLAMYSYNTYPGWLFKEYARDIMLFHTRQANEFGAKTEVEESRAVLDFAADFAANRKDYFASSLAWMQKHIKEVSDHYLAHEYIEVENAPCYFTEFCRRLQEKDLQCVSDFHWNTHYALKKGDRLKPLLKKEQSDIVLEQYCDFVVNQTFRSSVICRSGLNVQFRENDILNRYHFFMPIGSTIETVEAQDDHPAAWRFTLKNKEFSMKRSPLTDLVGEYFTNNKSGFFTTNDLCKTILPKLQDGNDVKVHLDALGSILSRIVQAGIIIIVLRPPTDRVSDLRRPYARTFVRQMLKRDLTVVPNTMFEPVKVNPHEAKLMKQFDGRRTITEYVTDIQNEIRKGRLRIDHEGAAIRADQRDEITQLVEGIVEKLRSLRLVI